MCWAGETPRARSVRSSIANPRSRTAYHSLQRSYAASLADGDQAPAPCQLQEWKITGLRNRRLYVMIRVEGAYDNKSDFNRAKEK